LGNPLPPQSEEPLAVAVVGAGLAGLMAARTLADHGHHVTVFDKSRRPGGRTAIRRADPFAFDHGAQYFTVRDPRVRRYVDAWIDAGIVAEWTGRIVALEDGKATAHNSTTRDSTTRYVGVPGMNAVARHLADGLHLVAHTQITSLARVGSSAEGSPGWRLTADSGADWTGFDELVVALPSAQAGDLLATAGIEDAQIRECALAPCWAVLLGFDQSLDVPFDGAFVGSGPLSWIARNNSKPGRPPAESWVLHAGPDWSTEYLEAERETVIADLLAAFESATGLANLNPPHRDAHRWRYALPPKPLTTGCLADPTAHWTICGDWCQGARIEGALLSGQAAAGRILNSSE
jgi:renalase